MKQFVKFGAYLVLCSGLVLGATGCCDEDPDYENVTPPVVVVSHSIGGRVTDMNGAALTGATINLSGVATKTATTNAEGYFVFAGVKAGAYGLKVTATGKIAKEGSVTVADSQTAQACVWNAALNADVTETVTVSQTQPTTATMTSEASKDNTAAAVKVDVTVPAAAVPAGKTIAFSPFYSTESVTTKAAESVLVIGATVKCSDPAATLAHPIEMALNLDAEMAAAVTAKKYVNGAWVAAASSVNGDKVIITVDAFAAYGLFVNVSYASTTGSAAIGFEKSEWDNLYGSAPMAVGDASYTYKTGTEITTAGTGRLGAALKEILVRNYGVGVKTTQATYPINVSLPVGTKLTVAGTQAFKTHTATSGAKSAALKAYGNVTISTATSNRQHTGGSN